MTISIRSLSPEDWPLVQEIYQKGIETGNATYETQAPPVEIMKSKYLPAPQLVAEANGTVVGWGMLSAVSQRAVYTGVAEVSIYVDDSHKGQGMGKALLRQLVCESERLVFWTLQSSIFPENRASLTIHEQCGFRQVGYRERLAKRHGVWRDVILLERRSTVTGFN